MQYHFVSFRQTGFEDFDYTSKVSIKFNLANYTIATGEDLVIFERLYSHQLTGEEIEKLVKVLASKHIDFIEDKVESKIDHGQQLKVLHDWLESD